MIVLPYGTLPTPSFFNILCRKAGEKTPRELLALLRAMLQRHGPCPYVLGELEAVGVTWGPPPGASELDLDVAAVADALNSPAAPVSDASHGVARSEAPSPSAFTTSGAAGGVADVAVNLVEEHDGSHADCRSCDAVRKWNRSFAAIDGRSAQ